MSERGGRRGGEGREGVENRGRREGGGREWRREGEKDGVRWYLVSFLLLQSSCGDADRELAALWSVASACFHQDAGMKTYQQSYPGTSCLTEVVNIFVHCSYTHTHTHPAATQCPRGVESTGRLCEASCRCDSREHRGGTSGEDTGSTLEYHL